MHVSYYYNFKNIPNNKIEILMLNVCGDVYVEQNKFKISCSCHLDYKRTLSRDSINRGMFYTFFSIMTSYRLLCTIFTPYGLSKFGMLKLTFDSALL